MKISIQAPYYCNEVGQRENNEDAIYPRPGLATTDSNLFLVCDGMGGHERGEVASAVTSEAIAHYWIINEELDDTEQKLQEAIRFAVEKMSPLDAETGSERKMGTTLTLLSLGKDAVFVAHVGDSRIYQFRPGEGIVFRSKDHSLVQRWVDAGLLTEQEARQHPKKNIITQVILSEPSTDIRPEAAILKDLKSGDCFLLCTDGVIEAWTDEALTELFDGNDTAEEKMNRLVEVCKEQSRDNFSAYLIPIQVEEEAIDLMEAARQEQGLSAQDLQDLHEAQLMRQVDEALDRRHREVEDVEHTEKMSYFKELLDKCWQAINQVLKKKNP